MSGYTCVDILYDEPCRGTLSKALRGLIAQLAERDKEIANLKAASGHAWHGSTHSTDCYTWGRTHYECALYEIERLNQYNKNLIMVNKDCNLHFDCIKADYDEAILKIERLKTALEFYADTENYEYRAADTHVMTNVEWNVIDLDEGAIARDALRESE